MRESFTKKDVITILKILRLLTEKNHTCFLLCLVHNRMKINVLNSFINKQ